MCGGQVLEICAVFFRQPQRLQATSHNGVAVAANHGASQLRVRQLSCQPELCTLRNLEGSWIDAASMSMQHRQPTTIVPTTLADMNNIVL